VNNRGIRSLASPERSIAAIFQRAGLRAAGPISAEYTPATAAGTSAGRLTATGQPAWHFWWD
jgi:hypothetical protein